MENDTKTEDFNAELFNISQEFEDLRISLDQAGSVSLNLVARRC